MPTRDFYLKFSDNEEPYLQRENLFVVSNKKTLCGNKKAQSLQNHDNTIIVRYDTRSSIVQALIATLIRGEFYLYRKMLEQKVKVQLVSNQHPSTPSFDSLGTGLY